MTVRPPRAGGTPRHRRRTTAHAGILPDGAALFTLERWRIERALEQRSRYRYVQPRVVADGLGWRIVSPNCSRCIDPQGGDIDIARLDPLGQGRWALLARDHVHGGWRAEPDVLTLDDALERLCSDPVGRFWP